LAAVAFAAALPPFFELELVDCEPLAVTVTVTVTVLEVSVLLRLLPESIEDELLEVSVPFKLLPESMEDELLEESVPLPESMEDELLEESVPLPESMEDELLEPEMSVLFKLLPESMEDELLELELLVPEFSVEFDEPELDDSDPMLFEIPSFEAPLAWDASDFEELPAVWPLASVRVIRSAAKGWGAASTVVACAATKAKRGYLNNMVEE